MAIRLPRQIHKHPYPLPKKVSIPESVTVPFEDVSHVPGQAAAIRLFDPHSKDDLSAMRDILKGKLVRRWMDDTRQISKAEYKDWAGNLTDMSLLFAVLDVRGIDVKEIRRIRGFVYVYSEHGEKFRVRRMEKLGFTKLTDEKVHHLEISFAVRPLKYGMQTGSGLMSSAVRQCCLQTKTLLSNLEQTKIEFFAFCDQGNVAAQRTVEAAGFVRKGLMKYDRDSEEESVLYVLNWRLLQKKIREKLLEVLKEEVV